MSWCSCSRAFPSWSSPRCDNSWVLLGALPMQWSLPIASTVSCVSWALRPNSLWNPPVSGVVFLANFLSCRLRDFHFPGSLSVAR
eukprot:1609880-Heterocapsa_arctica.AAC.1